MNLKPIFTLILPLRNCIRCGEPPCPHCGIWCDILDPENPCAEPMECVYRDEDRIYNRIVLMIFGRFKKLVQGAVGDSTDESGRLVLLAKDTP